LRCFSIRTTGGAIRCDFAQESDRKSSFKAGLDDYELSGQAIAVLTEQITLNGFESKNKRKSVWKYAWGQMLFVISIILYSSLTSLTQIDRTGITSRAVERMADMLPKKARVLFCSPDGSMDCNAFYYLVRWNSRPPRSTDKATRGRVLTATKLAISLRSGLLHACGGASSAPSAKVLLEIPNKIAPHPTIDPDTLQDWI